MILSAFPRIYKASVRRRFLLAFVCLLLTTPFSAHGQEPDNDDEVLRISTDLLLFNVRIKAKDHVSIEGLSQEAFTLKDKDGVTAGIYFYRGLDRISLVFALDQSGSTRDIIVRQRNAALGLFGKFGERSKVAVLRFAESPTVAAPFERNVDAVRDAFNFPVAVNQHTAIFDAAAASVSLFSNLPRVRSERRIVVLISDGLDNASKTNAKAVVEAAQRNRVSFYVIHIPLFEPRDGRLSVRRTASGFRDLAEKTGGKYFLAGDTRAALTPNTEFDLAPIFKAIEDDLKSQFLLGFYLNERANDGRRHEFSLSMPEGFQYQVSGRSFERTQKFFVHNPRVFPQRNEQIPH